MKIRLTFFFLLSMTCSLIGQQTSNILFSNFEANNQLIELDIQTNEEGTYFVLGVVQNNQVIGSSSFFARQGAHHYDLRSLPEWSGKIDYLVTTLPEAAINKKSLVQSSLSAEWDIFLAAEKLTPRLINFTKPKTFVGWSFNYILLLVALISTSLLIVVIKKKAVIAAFIGILIATVLMDARQTVDHFSIKQEVQGNGYYISPIDLTEKFIQKARPLITDAWTFEGKFSEEYYKLYFQYALADLQYIWNLKNFELPSGTFVITQNPAQDQEILLQENGFYLAKKR